MEKISQQESQGSNAAENFKKKRISDLIWSTMPKLGETVHSQEDRDGVRALEAFIEQYAGKFGPEADESSTVEEMEHMFADYLAIPGNEGIVAVETPEQLYEIRSGSDEIPVRNIQKQIWRILPHVSNKVHGLAERDGARNLDAFMEKYAGKFGEDATPIHLHEAEEMYAEFAEIAGEHFQLLDIDEIKESDLYSS